MLPAGLEPAIRTRERPQTLALHRTATGISVKSIRHIKISTTKNNGIMKNIKQEAKDSVGNHKLPLFIRSSRSAAVQNIYSGNLTPITQFSSPWHNHNTGWVNPCPNERWAGGNCDRVQWPDCSRSPVRFVSPAAQWTSCLPVLTRTGMKNCGDRY